MAESMSTCSECREETTVVVDYASGDTVCTECGLVLEAHLIDENPEWRTFTVDGAGDDIDPVRVGGPSSPLLSDNGLATVISYNRGINSGGAAATQAGGNSVEASLGRWQNQVPDPDRSLVEAFRSIAAMADRLCLVASIKDRACEIYKKVQGMKSIKGRNRDAATAACLYIACIQEANPRTFKEICSVANGASTKEIGRAKRLIVQQLQEETDTPVETGGTVRAADCLRRFCCHLGMSNRSVKAAIQLVETAEEILYIRRSPISMAAVAIYVISQLSSAAEEGGKKLLPLSAISSVTGVAESTIRSSYKDLYPHASRVVPRWFACDQDLIFRNLCAP